MESSSNVLAVMVFVFNCMMSVYNSLLNCSWIFFFLAIIPFGNSNTLATSYEELTHWKRPWWWEGLGAGGEGDDSRWDGWMASPTQWTWGWVNSWSWWWTGRPGMMLFIGSQRVWHDWEIEQKWTELKLNKSLWQWTLKYWISFSQGSLEWLWKYLLQQKGQIS